MEFYKIVKHEAGYRVELERDQTGVKLNNETYANWPSFYILAISGKCNCLCGFAVI